MRIDFTQATTLADLGNVAAQTGSVQRKAEAAPDPVVGRDFPPAEAAASKATPAAIPQPSQLNVTLDDKQNVIYRFTDPANGTVVRQVPPEEILRIMRNIEDLLHESEQKLKVAL